MTAFIRTCMTAALTALAPAGMCGTAPALQVGFTETTVGSFKSHSPGYSLELNQNEVILRASATFRLRWLDANPHPAILGEGQMPGSVSYFLGNDPSMWRTALPHYQQVRYKQIYPGIDLRFHTRSGQFEHDWIVAPGADPARIRLEFPGAKLRVDASGDLVIRRDGAELRQHAPVVFQSGVHTPGEYVVHPGSRVSFHVAGYDRHKPLVIDPVLSYSTFLGGSENDGAFAVTTDKAGNAYVAGLTSSRDFPAASGGLSAPTVGVAMNAFVAKLNPSGTALVYMAYLGGSDEDMAMAIAVDDAGNAYVTGGTHSSDFPVTAGALQTVYGGTGGSSLPPSFHPAGDAFITKLNPTGSSLLYSSYIGGPGKDQGYGIAIDSSGNAYIAGTTSFDYAPGLPDHFPTTSGAFQTKRAGSTDGFIAKLNPTGTAVIYCSFLGGSNEDYIFGLAVDAQGGAYVTGFTVSPDFPVTPRAFQTNASGTPMAFAAKLNAAGAALVYGTYLGGSLYNAAYGIAADSKGNAYITGITNSKDFPATPDAYPSYQRQIGPRTDVFVTKLNPTGDAVFYSSVFGGNVSDYATSIALDPAGNAYIAGRSSSTNFPTTPSAPQRCGGNGAFLAEIDSTGATLPFSTRLGGSTRQSAATAVTIGPDGRIWLVGSTNSPDFPVTVDAFQRAYRGEGVDAFDAESLMPYGGDVFVSKIDLSGPVKLNAACVVNSASLGAGPISPGEIVSILGGGMGPEAGSSGTITDGRVDTSLADAQVFFDGVAAPLLYVRSDQINAVAPFGIGSTSTQVQVKYKGELSNTLSAPVFPVTPAIFTLDGSGTGQAAIINQDGSLNSTAYPAAPGSVVSLWMTGLGQTDPAGEDGKLNMNPLPKPLLPVGAIVGGTQADVLYAGAGPLLVAGAFQVNIRIPAGTPASDTTRLMVTLQDPRGFVVPAQDGVTLVVR